MALQLGRKFTVSTPEPRRVAGMNDPDFTHIVDTNRFRKNEVNTPSRNSTTRAYMNENIKLRFEDGSTSTVPRFRIDKEFVQSAVNRMTAKKAASKPKEVFKSHLFSAKESTKDGSTKLTYRLPSLMFSHLHHRDSNTIIMSDTEMKTKCSANVTYDVVAMPALAINDGGVLSLRRSRSSKSLSILSPALSHHTESHYDGDVLFIVHGVPTTTQNGVYEVTENDVKIWLVSGAIASLEPIDVLTKKIKSLKETLLQIEKELASLPPTSIASGKGRVNIGSSLNNVRDKKLCVEKERCISLIQTATQSLETLYSQHMGDCKLIVEKRTKDNALDDKSCDWAILVDGDEKGIYTRLIEKNKNWSMIPMYAFGTNTNKTPISLPIPEDDQSHHFVDIRGVKFSRLPHGFGVFECYEEFDPYHSSGKWRSRHRLYHGQFHEGEFSEGSLYTEAGTFSGTFNKGQPIEGTMQYADGVKISGEFAIDDVPLQTSTNPYRRGLSDGFQIIKFSDKATYEGGVKQGRITGKGTYKCAGLQLSGEFQDGVLQVDEGVEGHGFSNLHLSFMYGERLWGAPSTKHTSSFNQT